MSAKITDDKGYEILKNSERPLLFSGADRSDFARNIQSKNQAARLSRMTFLPLGRFRRKGGNSMRNMSNIRLQVFVIVTLISPDLEYSL
ncbi:MAG: hypothetical protein IJI07_10990 [Flexilinea sp.]|nr:hypothetical protein [Flexilinea sp.]